MKTLTVLVPAFVLAACTKDRSPFVPEPEKKPATQEYSVALVARAPYTASQPATAVFTVAAKAGYHVNPEYPMVFKPEGQSGVRFAEERLKLTWGLKTPCGDKPDDTCAVEVPIALTPEKAGPAVVAGLVAFSVCNPQHCLIEKVPLSLAIDVK